MCTTQKSKCFSWLIVYNEYVSLLDNIQLYCVLKYINKLNSYTFYQGISIPRRSVLETTREQIGNQPVQTGQLVRRSGWMWGHWCYTDDRQHARRSWDGIENENVAYAEILDRYYLSVDVMSLEVWYVFAPFIDARSVSHIFNKFICFVLFNMHGWLHLAVSHYNGSRFHCFYKVQM